MHYSEQILEYMIKELEYTQDKLTGTLYKKFENVAPAGQFSDGSRLVAVAFDNSGRYIEAMLGFQTLVDMDCRDYDPDESAILFDEKIKESLYNAK